MTLVSTWICFFCPDSCKGWRGPRSGDGPIRALPAQAPEIAALSHSEHVTDTPRLQLEHWVPTRGPFLPENLCPWVGIFLLNPSKHEGPAFPPVLLKVLPPADLVTPVGTGIGIFSDFGDSLALPRTLYHTPSIPGSPS